jgi:hypothetical protein
MLGGPLGDSMGSTYGVVLDGTDQERTILHHHLHMPGDYEKPSVVWAGDRAVVYAQYDGLYKYDLDRGETFRLLEFSRDAFGYPNMVAYDAVTNDIYLYMQVIREKATGDFYERADLDLWRIPLDDPGRPAVAESVTRTIPADKYHFMRLPIVPLSGGIYWGRTIDGVYHTDYEARDGSVWRAEGLLVAAFDDWAYLKTKAGWTIWRPGSEPFAIDVPADVSVQPFGKYLVWRQDDGRWIAFDPDAGRRREFLPADDDGIGIPYQPYDAVYRVHPIRVLD